LSIFSLQVAVVAELDLLLAVVALAECLAVQLQ
jgi:hypothetical protein